MMFAKGFTWPGVIAWSCEIPVVRIAIAGFEIRHDQNLRTSCNLGSVAHTGAAAVFVDEFDAPSCGSLSLPSLFAIRLQGDFNGMQGGMIPPIAENHCAASRQLVCNAQFNSATAPAFVSYWSNSGQVEHRP
jgi:hypothetical protein